MFMLISDFGRLYVADFMMNKKMQSKIIHSESKKLVVNGTVLHPFVEDVETNTPVLVSNSNHVKPLGYYMNPLGWKKKIPDYEKQKQQKVIK